MTSGFSFYKNWFRAPLFQNSQNRKSNLKRQGFSNIVVLTYMSLGLFAVNEKITEDKDLCHDLALRLDRRHPVTKNWEHLACAEPLNVPPDVRLKFKLNSKYSPTEQLFSLLEIRHPTLTVDKLVSALQSIKRNDVVDIITKVVSGIQRDNI